MALALGHHAARARLRGEHPAHRHSAATARLMDVSITDLHLARNGRKVLQIPGLRFPSGTTTAVFGPNGSGKTTLLRGRSRTGTARSRAKCDSGGLPAGRDPAWRRVAMSFQNPSFSEAAYAITSISHFDCAISSCGATIPHGRGGRECGVAASARIGPRESSPEVRPSESICARALALRAPVTLLDEPLSGVDRSTRIQLLAELPRLLCQIRRDNHSGDSRPGGGLSLGRSAGRAG